VGRRLRYSSVWWNQAVRMCNIYSATTRTPTCHLPFHWLSFLGCSFPPFSQRCWLFKK
jgi:hypothetical protein